MNSLIRLQGLYGRASRELASIGPACPGSLIKRFMPCGKPSCRCAKDPEARHGPYFEWTRKVGGKTVSVRLSRAQAPIYKEWIKNDRRLEKIIGRLRALGVKMAELRRGLEQ